MKPYLDYSKKCIYYCSMIFAGLLLFLALSSFEINASIMNPKFHKELFVKNQLYNHTYSFLKDSINDFVDRIKKYSPMDYQQHEDIFKIMESSITLEVVTANLDSIREDSFQYFKGNRMFLPDIYLGHLSKNEPPEPVIENKDNKLSAQAISKIEKINLSAILLYINRSDITDYFLTMKFFYFVLNIIPELAVLLLLIMLILGVASSAGIKKSIQWICIVFTVNGALCLIAGISLAIYSRWLLPSNIRFLALSLPMEAEVLISYMRYCISSNYVFLISCGLLSILVAFLSGTLQKVLPGLVRNLIMKEDIYNRYRLTLICSLAGLTLAFLIGAVSYKVQSFKTEYRSNNFSPVVSRLRNRNKVTQVISAKDEAIYALQIKLVDSKEGTPIPYTPINISGKSTLLKKEFNETMPTDIDGAAKFVLDEGTFRLSFLQYDFPSSYYIPSPFFFELKSAGTTIITIPVDKAPETSMYRWGIAEIEVLDDSNNPVPEIQLSIPYSLSAPGEPDSVFSYTNSEGIAVFKLNEGDYSAIFTGTGFPQEYKLPSPINIKVSPDSITRYTYRLAKTTKQGKVQKPGNIKN